MLSAQDWIKALDLQAHPEGGFFRETYRCERSLVVDEGQSRNSSTSIYFLLRNEDRSHFHRLSSDEIWYFHTGNPIEVLILAPGESSLQHRYLGLNLLDGEQAQLLIPAGCWFAARVLNKSQADFSLISCSVSPGFDFEDFELAGEDFVTEYPNVARDYRDLLIQTRS